MGETDAASGEPIKIRGFIVLGTITAKRFPADIISHNEDDVRFLHLTKRAGKARAITQRKVRMHYPHKSAAIVKNPPWLATSFRS